MMICVNRVSAPHRERDRWLVALLVSAGLAGNAVPALSQDNEDSAKPTVSRDDFDIASPTESLEEVVVVGRQKVTAIDVIAERMELDVVADFLDAEAIARTGDSTVSLALRRVPGLTLVNGQFVYVRGLGERYSNVLLNSAYVPSPDLTRNVLPLDIFPTVILDSLAITKTYSPDLPAGFGGGSVNIRTKNVPDGPVLSFEMGTGYNTESSEDGFRALNGDDDFLGSDDGTRAFPQALDAALQDFQGEIGAASIAGSLIAEGSGLSLVEAQTQAEQINRQLATALNRDIGFTQESLGPGANLEVVGGNSWILGGAERWQFGVLALGKYRRSERNRERINRGVTDPEITNSRTLRTIDRVTITGALNTGLNFTDDHSISTTSLFLRNTEDEASLTLGNNFNFIAEDGQQFRNFDVRFEERELRGHQVRGSHTIGSDTTELLGFLDNPLTRDLKLDWFYSDTTAQTDIPSELRVSAEDQIDPVTGEVLVSNVRASGSALDYRFTNLEDEQESYGYTLSKPVFGNNYDVTFSGGYAYTRKTRNYRQREFDLGSTNPADVGVLQGAPEDVFSDANILDPANQFVLSVGGIGTESYLAAQTILAGFGKVDWRYGEHWRVSAGARYEDFQQASLPFNPFEFDVGVGQVAVPDDELDTLVFAESDVYPSLAVTWATNDFWARDFQLRFGVSQTVTRPDLREISVATFIDPLTEARVRGNSGLVTSAITNVDLRAEWFFASGDNFTVSLFYKDISDPIETIKEAGTDDNVSLTFVNGESAEYYGVEVEWFKDLSAFEGLVGSWINPFYFSGNFFLSDAEITIGEVALDLTNNTRRPTQHSQWGANLQFGFDAPNEKHSASMVYNVFGERLFFAERFGAPDGFEQPFHSLDLVYSWFPTDRVEARVRMQNLLDDNVEITQGGVSTIEQTLGRTGRIDISWSF